MQTPVVICASGPRQLASGKSIFVGELEESWVTVDIGDGVRVRVDLDVGVGRVWIDLHWAHCPLDGPPGTLPYGREATVRYLPSAADPLVIENIPAANHQKDCEYCPIKDTPQFGTDIAATDLESYLDLLCGLPRADRFWFVDADGTPLWRGQVDEQRRAIIELITPDDSLWRSTTFAIVERLPVGLGPTPRT